MTTKFADIIFNIKDENGLELTPGVNIRLPLRDGQCYCCGKHIWELKPFDEPGDPLFLARSCRLGGPYDEEAESACNEALRCYEADGFDNPRDWMIDKFGKEKATSINKAMFAYSSPVLGWECKDCIGLDMDEYLEKTKKCYKTSILPQADGV